MRFGIFMGLALMVGGCGGQKKQCFECGITDEWREAEERERGKAQREDAGLNPEGEALAAPPADAGPPPCEIPASEENPRPCEDAAPVSEPGGAQDAAHIE